MYMNYKLGLMCAYLSKFFSVQIALKLYFQTFYSTAPTKIVIILTKLKRKNVKLKYLEDIKKTISNKKNTFSKRNHRIMLLQNKFRQKVGIKTSTMERLSKTTG